MTTWLYSGMLALMVLSGTAQAQQGGPATGPGRYVFQFNPDLQRPSAWVGDTTTGQVWLCSTTSCAPTAAPSAATRAGGRADCVPAPPPGFKVTDPNVVICK